MRQEIVTHRVGFPADEPVDEPTASYCVFICEGGADDGLVVVEMPDGFLVRPDADGIPQRVSLDDCNLRQVGGEHDTFEDAATVMLYIQEREILIRASCELAQLTGKNMTAEWFGQDVAHAFKVGGFIRVEDLKPRVMR